MSKMNPEITAKWVAALRSGEYVQAKKQLRVTIVSSDAEDRFSYCCLGVLCEVAGIPYAPHCADLSEVVGEEDALLSQEVQDDLTFRNDGFGSYKDNPQTFAQIADHIEANL